MALSLGESYRHTSETRAFEELVYPTLAGLGYLPRGSLMHAEGSSQDLRGGIDWVISARDGTQYSIASRVQWAIDYGTFSVRYRTAAGQMSELTKRVRSVLEDGMYPTFTVQAYVTKAGDLINAYVVRTEDLYRHMVRLTDHDHFNLCACAGRKRMAPGGAMYIPVAITERGRVAANSQATLIGHGVPVSMVRPRDVGAGMGLTV